MKRFQKIGLLSILLSVVVAFTAIGFTFPASAAVANHVTPRLVVDGSTIPSEFVRGSQLDLSRAVASARGYHYFAYSETQALAGDFARREDVTNLVSFRLFQPNNPSPIEARNITHNRHNLHVDGVWRVEFYLTNSRDGRVATSEAVETFYIFVNPQANFTGTRAVRNVEINYDAVENYLNDRGSQFGGRLYTGIELTIPTPRIIHAAADNARPNMDYRVHALATNETDAPVNTADPEYLVPAMRINRGTATEPDWVFVPYRFQLEVSLTTPSGITLDGRLETAYNYPLDNRPTNGPIPDNFFTTYTMHTNKTAFGTRNAAGEWVPFFLREAGRHTLTFRVLQSTPHLHNVAPVTEITHNFEVYLDTVAPTLTVAGSANITLNAVNTPQHPNVQQLEGAGTRRVNLPNFSRYYLDDNVADEHEINITVEVQRLRSGLLPGAAYEDDWLPTNIEVEARTPSINDPAYWHTFEARTNFFFTLDISGYYRVVVIATDRTGNWAILNDHVYTIEVLAEDAVPVISINPELLPTELQPSEIANLPPFTIHYDTLPVVTNDAPYRVAILSSAPGVVSVSQNQNLVYQLTGGADGESVITIGVVSVRTLLDMFPGSFANIATPLVSEIDAAFGLLLAEWTPQFDREFSFTVNVRDRTPPSIHARWADEGVELAPDATHNWVNNEFVQTITPDRAGALTEIRIPSPFVNDSNPAAPHIEFAWQNDLTITAPGDTGLDFFAPRQTIMHGSVAAAFTLDVVQEGIRDRNLLPHQREYYVIRMSAAGATMRPGLYEVTFRARDATGNIGTRTYEIRVGHATEPVTRIPTGFGFRDEGSEATSGASITLTARPVNAEVRFPRLTVEHTAGITTQERAIIRIGGSVIELEPIVTGAGDRYFRFTPTQTGTHTITIEVADRYGNRTTIENMFTIAITSTEAGPGMDDSGVHVAVWIVLGSLGVAVVAGFAIFFILRRRNRA
ncbi:MAG: hypothetical protein FWB72_01410 [Firmicutes bacterium]|nr:hypothetical protein [Bacillota bacterium]